MNFKNILPTATITLLTLLQCFNLSAKRETLSISSQYLKPEAKVMVVTPDDYDTEGNDSRYPVVYLLHGYSDNYTCWPERTQPALDSLATTYGMIFVCPDGRNSWYFDSKVNPDMQMESFITRDLVKYIDENYRTKPQASQRAITGLSMGGHGALWLGMRHSDIWKNCGSTSGGVDFIPFAPDCWEIQNALGSYKDNRELWEKSTVMSLVPSLKPDQLNIIFDCGSEDFFFQVNDNLHKALLEAKIPHDYISRPGTHCHPYWRNAILFQLQYFNEKFKARQ